MFAASRLFSTHGGNKHNCNAMYYLRRWAQKLSDIAQECSHHGGPCNDRNENKGLAQGRILCFRGCVRDQSYCCCCSASLAAAMAAASQSPGIARLSLSGGGGAFDGDTCTDTVNWLSVAPLKT